jgi:hypothetical protein
MKRMLLSISLLAIFPVVEAKAFNLKQVYSLVQKYTVPTFKIAGAAGLAYVSGNCLKIAAEEAQHLRAESLATPNFSFKESSFAQRYAFTGLTFLGGAIINAAISAFLGHSAFKDIKNR